MDCNGSTQLLLEQITEGQLQWVPLEKQYDTVVIGDAENARRYPVCGGRQDDYKKALYKSFPKEKKAIDRYMDMLKVSLTLLIYCMLVKTTMATKDKQKTTNKKKKSFQYGVEQVWTFCVDLVIRRSLDMNTILVKYSETYALNNC